MKKLAQRLSMKRRHQSALYSDDVDGENAVGHNLY